MKLTLAVITVTQNARTDMYNVVLLLMWLYEYWTLVTSSSKAYKSQHIDSQYWACMVHYCVCVLCVSLC